MRSRGFGTPCHGISPLGGGSAINQRCGTIRMAVGPLRVRLVTELARLPCEHRVSLLNGQNTLTSHCPPSNGAVPNKLPLSPSRNVM